MAQSVLGGRARLLPTGHVAARLDDSLFALLFSVSLVPVLVTPIPAMVDYVNHLARMYVIAASGTPDASPFYHVTSAFYPNLAMDLVVPRLARMLGVETATRAFLLVTQILIVTGALAIERAVKGRAQISGYAALIILYSVPFAWGFLNFEFALGLALWGIAAWLALRDQPGWIRLSAHIPMVGVLFVSHLFALGLYGFALGIHELWAARARPIRRTIVALLVLGVPFLVIALFMALSHDPVGRPVNEWELLFKPLWPFMILNGYSAILSGTGACVLLLLLQALIRERALSFEGSGAWLCATFPMLYLAVPARLLDTAFVDIRVIVAGVLIVPAFVTVRAPSANLRRAGLAIVSGLILINVGVVASVWLSYQAEYRAMIASFGRIEKGAHVLVAYGPDGQDPPMRDLTAYPIYHAPTLAAAYAKAFVPTLFTTVGKQPIAVVPTEQRLAYSCGGPVSTSVLAAVADGHLAAETPDFVRSWTRDFDYVYVVVPQAENPMPGRLEPMEAHPRFTLYRVRKPVIRNLVIRNLVIRKPVALTSPPPAAG